LFEKIDWSVWVLFISFVILLGVGYAWLGPRSRTASIHDPARSGDRIRLPLRELRSTTLSGTATVQRDTGSLDVTLTIRGIEPGRVYKAHLHEGTCGSVAGGGVTLNPVESPDRRRATSRTTVPREELNPTMDHLIMIHHPDGHHALCGNLPS